MSLLPDLPCESSCQVGDCIPANDAVTMAERFEMSAGRPIRVLHVFKVFYPDSFGGIEQTIRQIACNTAGRGIDNTVWTLSANASLPEREEVNQQFSVVRAKAHFSVASTPVSFSAMESFRQAARQADLLHYHYPWPFGDVLHLASRPHRPAIVTYHSDIVRQRILVPMYQPLMRWFLSSMDAIVATSPNYLRTSDVLQRFRDKVSVIPIGIDAATYPQPSSERIRFWEPIFGRDFFLFVGAIRYYKGLHILLDACANTALRVVIVGAGPIEDELRAQARRLKLLNVYFLGALPDEDKVALLQLCRAVVFPSHLRSEAFGITLLEGAMYSKPLISSEIGTGSSYVNVHNETGLVVPPSDARAFRTAMQRLATDDALVARLGRGANARFRHTFTATQMGASYSALYQKVVKRAKRAG